MQEFAKIENKLKNLKIKPRAKFKYFLLLRLLANTLKKEFNSLLVFKSFWKSGVVFATLLIFAVSAAFYFKTPDYQKDINLAKERLSSLESVLAGESIETLSLIPIALAESAALNEELVITLSEEVLYFTEEAMEKADNLNAADELADALKEINELQNQEMKVFVKAAEAVMTEQLSFKIATIIEATTVNYREVKNVISEVNESIAAEIPGKKLEIDLKPSIREIKLKDYPTQIKNKTLPPLVNNVTESELQVKIDQLKSGLENEISALAENSEKRAELISELTKAKIHLEQGNYKKAYAVMLSLSVKTELIQNAAANAPALDKIIEEIKLNDGPESENPLKEILEETLSIPREQNIRNENPSDLPEKTEDLKGSIINEINEKLEEDSILSKPEYLQKKDLEAAEQNKENPLPDSFLDEPKEKLEDIKSQFNERRSEIYKKEPQESLPATLLIEKTENLSGSTLGNLSGNTLTEKTEEEKYLNDLNTNYNDDEFEEVLNEISSQSEKEALLTPETDFNSEVQNLGSQPANLPESEEISEKLEEKIEEIIPESLPKAPELIEELKENLEKLFSLPEPALPEVKNENTFMENVETPILEKSPNLIEEEKIIEKIDEITEEFEKPEKQENIKEILPEINTDQIKEKAESAQTKRGR